MDQPVKSPMVELNDFKPKNSSDFDDRNESSDTSTDASSAATVECEDDVFFDALSVQFHFGTFLYQLIAHLLLPLYFFMVNRHGQVTADFLNIAGSVGAPLLVYLMIVSYNMIPSVDREPAMDGAFVIPLIYFLQHRMVIAIKYGSMSRTEYHRFMSCLDRATCCKYLAQVQLFQGWYDFNPLVIRFELSAASAKIGARINEIDVMIQDPNHSPSALNQLRAWNAFIRGHDVIDFNSKPCKQLRIQSDGSYALSVYDYCEALLMHATKQRAETDTSCLRLITFFNWVNLTIPFVFMLCYAPKENVSTTTAAWMFFFYLSSTIINFMYAALFYLLLYISIVDVMRQKSVYNDLNNMIRISDIMLQAELSGNHKKVTQEELQETELRVAEIMSIRSCSHPARGKYVHCTFVGTEGGEGDSMRDTVSSAGSVVSVGRAISRSVGGSAGECVGGSAGERDAPKRTSVLGERIYKDNQCHMLPRINFNESHNIVAWTHARLVMQNFGERFKFRLEMYVIAAVAMLVVMMVVGLLNLGMSPDRIKLFFTPWFLQTLLSVTMCIGFLIIIMQIGACVNDILMSHTQTLCSHSLRLSRKVEKVQIALAKETNPAKIAKIEAKIEKLNAVIEKLDSMAQVVDTNNQLKPFKIFGFNAQSSLTMSIMTTAVSFYGVLISLLSNDSSLGDITSI